MLGASQCLFEEGPDSAGDANFDHLFKALPARFLHRTVTTLLFVINTYFIGSYFLDCSFHRTFLLVTVIIVAFA